ncbi:TonB-dependent receptor domain-containing protein [Halomonas garicola]|uniref:TonB-dependent receptor domain-containing protein n=1 Tax=Halomonas garicola TaxID=1690008 RepID=UPI00289C4A62|nr:TonB-dependent receptor [Halomonas garicola]
MSNRLFLSNRFSAGKTLVPFALAALPLAVSAQTPSISEQPDQAAADTLNPVVVTATRAPRTANETLSSVTVLDEATLRRQDPTELTDLLRGQPGVDVKTNGSFGKTSIVYLRGTSSGSTLFMIDGIRLRSATLGSPSYQYLDPRMFNRAEVVRGPRGSLYGADAVGGVIQLFTPQGEKAGPQPRISVGGGSFNTRRVSAGISGKSDSGQNGTTRYSFAGSHFATDGQPVRRGGEDMGYDNTSALARVSHTFNDGSEIGALALRARGNTEFDASGDKADTDYVQQVAGVYGELALSDDFRTRLTLSEARDETETEYYASEYTTQSRTVRWENTLDVGYHQFIAGAEYRDDSVEDSDTGFGTYEVESRDNKAVFTQALLDFAPLTVQGSLRFDNNEAYGEEVTGGLALGYALDDHHTARASYGTAFRAPTFNDLYYPDYGNSDLEAETSKTVELGVRGQYTSWFWDAAIYQTEIDNLISGQTSAFNTPEARIRGAEIASGVEIDGWTAQAALTYLEPEDKDTGNRLAGRASESLRLDLDRELGEWSVGGSWVAQNHRYADAANDERLAGYGIVNLRAGWAFAPLWQARVTLDNAFDNDYATTRFSNGDDYLNAGRAAYLSVSFGAQ